MKKKLLALVINLIIMGIVLVLVVWGVFRGIDGFTRHGQAIPVPDVKGLSIAEANAVFKKHGLTSIVSDSTYVRDEVPGRILDYTPSVGSAVKQGRIIYLTINTKSVPLMLVPDVADNSSARQARARILSVGFKLTDDEYISGQKDWVYEVKYMNRVLSAGSKAPIGATLTLVVGDGTDELTKDTLDLGVDSLFMETEGDSEETESWFN